MTILACKNEYCGYRFGKCKSTLGYAESSNNMWGVPSSEKTSTTFKQVMWYDDVTGKFGWEWTRLSPRSDLPSFPLFYVGKNIWVDKPYTTWSPLPIQLSKINSFHINMGTRYPIVPQNNPKFNLAYDIWVDDRVASDNTHVNLEIMIWVNCYPGACAPGVYQGSVNDGFSTYKAYYDPPHTTGRTWKYLAFVLDSPCLKVYSQINRSINLKKLIDFAINKKIANSSHYLRIIELGNEVWNGHAKLEINRFDMNVNGTSVNIVCPNSLMKQL